MQDRRFDLKFHVQDDIHRRRASERASKYNEKRVTVLKRHHAVKAFCDMIISTARDEHYEEPSDYNILGLPDARRTNRRPWKVSWSVSDFKEAGNGIVRPPCKAVPLELRPASSEQGNREEKAQDRDTDAPEESSAEPASAWEGRVTGTSLALSKTEPLVPPIIFERIHVSSPRYQDVMEEADKARTEGFMKDRGWTSKAYVGCIRDEDWTQNLKFGT